MGHGWVERMMIFMLEKRISIPMMPGQPRCQYQWVSAYLIGHEIKSYFFSTQVDLHEHSHHHQASLKQICSFVIILPIVSIIILHFNHYLHQYKWWTEIQTAKMSLCAGGHLFGRAGYCMVWIVLYCILLLWDSMILHTIARHSIILHCIVCYLMILISMVWYGMVWYGMVLHGMNRNQSSKYGIVCRGGLSHYRKYTMKGRRGTCGQKYNLIFSFKLPKYIYIYNSICSGVQPFKHSDV